MNLKSMTLPELTAVLKELGQPAFRAKQVYTWLHRGVRAYDEMTNLPKALRDTAGAGISHLRPQGGAQAGIRTGRHDQIPLGTVRRQLRGDGADALSLRQHRVHFHGGGLPHGLRLLRLHHRRTGAAAGTL